MIWRDHNIEIRIAKSADDRANILRLRDSIYVKEQGRLKHAEDLDDIFGEYEPYATYFVAYANGRAVGTTKVTVDSELGLPCERSVNLASLRPNNRLVEMGHCITVPEFRSRGLGLLLMRETIVFSAKHLDATHVLVDFFIDNEERIKVKFHMAMGFKPVGETYSDTRFENSPASMVAVLAISDASTVIGEDIRARTS